MLHIEEARALPLHFSRLFCKNGIKIRLFTYYAKRIQKKRKFFFFHKLSFNFYQQGFSSYKKRKSSAMFFLTKQYPHLHSIEHSNFYLPSQWYCRNIHLLCSYRINNPETNITVYQQRCPSCGIVQRLTH